MQLTQLIRGLPLTPPVPTPEVDVQGVCCDSRRVLPGDLFVAVVGEHHDGRRYAADAATRGAVAVVGQGQAPGGLDVPWIQADADTRPLLGRLAARAYGHPDRELLAVGVTGTNGKSTVVALVAAILEAAGKPTGLLGTLGYRFRGLDLTADRTTPEASDLIRMLRAMRDRGAEAVALEVSSHALALDRVVGVRFRVAAFTNLTRDHLDYHGDLEGYFAAKRQLFELLDDDGRAVVNVDDPWGRRLAAELPNALTFGAGGQVTAEQVRLGPSGIRAQVRTPRRGFAIESPLLGRFNVTNLLTAVAVAEVLEVPEAAIQEGLARQGPLPGRLEAMATPQRRELPLRVYVDYAHTPAALEAALRSVRELTDGEVIVVFGCGGDRDTGKRPQMGRLAGELADLPIVTSDNPRSEDPQHILAEVEPGLKASGNPRYRIVPDRREAIRRAIAVAPEGAAVLIAGKGHEEVQIIGDQTLPFSDRTEVEAALEERFGRAEAD